MNDTSEPKLLPCPFCGSPGKIGYGNDGKPWGWVSCLACNTQGPIPKGICEDEETLEVIAEAWNRRASEVRLSARLGGLPG